MQSAIQSVRRVALAANEAAARAQDRFKSAGLDPALLPLPPAFPDVLAARTVDHVPVDVLPGAAPAEVIRLEFPELDLETPAAGIRSSTTQSAHARHAAAERRTVAIGLRA